MHAVFTLPNVALHKQMNLH